MIKLRDEDINTPEWFDHIWSIEGMHSYDAVRLREFLQHMDSPRKHLLDVGAGWMGVAQYATQRDWVGQYTAIDYSVEARRRTLEMTPTLDYRTGSALALPFEANTFDIVACGELIEHFADPAPLVAELARVCKPGGRVIISTLDATCEAAKAHGDYLEHLVMWEKPDDLLPLFAPYGVSKAWIVGHYFMVECRKGAPVLV
jgi:2-polyprenyl-3-methyl-5-hydroxy-6-metoxy-1,4-benzoquinol methylase